ncbi:MAG TPA: hypothetical protein VFW65_23930 [Pseudonocardiaceae bacterium]|nr:hypothetical protein [Pseudonocardiaceae bacterium]
MIDPRRPSLTVCQLGGQVAEVVGDKAFEATRPFPVRIVPVDLLDGLSP